MESSLQEKKCTFHRKCTEYKSRYRFKNSPYAENSIVKGIRIVDEIDHEEAEPFVLDGFTVLYSQTCSLRTWPVGSDMVPRRVRVAGISYNSSSW